MFEWLIVVVAIILAYALAFVLSERQKFDLTALKFGVTALLIQAGVVVGLVLLSKLVGIPGFVLSILFLASPSISLYLVDWFTNFKITSPLRVWITVLGLYTLVVQLFIMFGLIAGITFKTLPGGLM